MAEPCERAFCTRDCSSHTRRKSHLITTILYLYAPLVNRLSTNQPYFVNTFTDFLICVSPYIFVVQYRYTNQCTSFDLFNIKLPTCFGLVWPSSGHYTIRIPRFTVRQYKITLRVFL
jgi:hypothetical protein